MKLQVWFSLPNPDGTRRLKRDFAGRIGVTPQMISAYCDGRHWPSKETVREIINATNGDVTANDLLPSEETAA